MLADVQLKLKELRKAFRKENKEANQAEDNMHAAERLLAKTKRRFARGKVTAERLEEVGDIAKSATEKYHQEYAEAEAARRAKQSFKVENKEELGAARRENSAQVAAAIVSVAETTFNTVAGLRGAGSVGERASILAEGILSHPGIPIGEEGRGAVEAFTAMLAAGSEPAGAE